MEYIDIVDENGKLTGEILEKTEAHLLGKWHLAAHVWIYNSKGELLLQKRSINKDTFPGMWDISVAGHISSGESVVEGAIREAKEEIGLDINEKYLEEMFIQKESHFHPKRNYYNNEFHYVYLYKFDGLLKDLKMQKSEVDDLRFISIDDLKLELKDLVLSKMYVGHPNYYDKIIEKVNAAVA